MTSGKSNLIDVEGELIEDREKSYMVDFGLDEPTFLPKSLTEYDGDITFTMPEWLAMEKGIV